MHKYRDKKVVGVFVRFHCAASSRYEAKIFNRSLIVQKKLIIV
jgi:hypothetical protein